MKGYDSRHPEGPNLPVSSSSHMITLFFDNGCVATLRGSGTEPKLKYYTELVGQEGQSRHEVDNLLQKVVQSIIDGFLQPERYGLVPPSD